MSAHSTQVKKIALVWPWFCTLADNYSQLINEMGIETLIITTKNNWNYVSLSTNSLTLEKIKISNLIPDIFQVRQALNSFSPDLIIQEESTDPRFIVSSFYKKPHFWKCRHDPEPHDENHFLTARQNMTVKLNTFRNEQTLSFSMNSMKAMNSKKMWNLVPEIPFNSLPKHAEIQAPRQNFVTFGRIEKYKNIEWLADTWEKNCNSFNNEKLYIYGSAPKDLSSTHVVHINTRYSAADLLPRLSTFRASIFPYLTATQSGTVLFSQSGSLASIISPLPGLIENQGSRKHLMASNSDEESLKALVIKFMDSEYANKEGVLARRHIDKVLKDVRRNLELSLKNWD